MLYSASSSGFGDSTGTMIGAKAQPFSESALEIELDRLQKILQHPAIGMAGMKQALADAVAGLARSVFGAADLTRLVEVLWSGAAPTWAGPDASEAERFCLLIGLLTDAVVGRITDSPGVAITAQDREKLLDVCQTLSKVDKLAVQYKSLSAVLASAALNRNKGFARNP